jgi:hypothetical protein
LPWFFCVNSARHLKCLHLKPSSPALEGIDKIAPHIGRLLRFGSLVRFIQKAAAQDNEIMLNTKRRRLKDRNLLRDPRLSLCVEDGYRYVVIRGPVELIDDQRIAQADIKRLSTRYHGPEMAEQQMSDQFSREERVTIRLTPERVQAYGFS